MDPDNGEVYTTAGTSIGSEATYDCDPGYELSNEANLTCIRIDDNSADWDGDLPTCEGN